MWLPRRCGSPRALMTLPRARRPLLIWMLSLSRSPVLPVLSTLSEPARSTKWNLETSSWPAAGRGRRLGMRPRCSRVTVKIVWERLERRLKCVAPVCRAALPTSRRLSTSSRPSTSTSFTPHSTEGKEGCEPRAGTARTPQPGGPEKQGLPFTALPDSDVPSPSPGAPARPGSGLRGPNFPHTHLSASQDGYRTPTEGPEGLTNIPTVIFPKLDVTAGSAHLQQVSELLLVGHMHQTVKQVILIDKLEGLSHGPWDDALLILTKGGWGDTKGPPATMPSARHSPRPLLAAGRRVSSMEKEIPGPVNVGTGSQSGSLTHTGFPHGVRLPRTCLTIGKDGGIEALKESLEERLHTGLVHSLLPSTLIQHHVEAKMAVSTQGDTAMPRLHPQAGLVAMQQLLGQQWADSQGHPHWGLLSPWRPLSLQPHAEGELLWALQREEEGPAISTSAPGTRLTLQVTWSQILQLLTLVRWRGGRSKFRTSSVPECGAQMLHVRHSDI
ncbi:hypothetical protein MC885_005974 [Smutsia gigantea]|nr:hypothetical protein MC885_005974 [Smutsia gigantea]